MLLKYLSLYLLHHHQNYQLIIVNLRYSCQFDQLQVRNYFALNHVVPAFDSADFNQVFQRVLTVQVRAGSEYPTLQRTATLCSHCYL